MSMVFNPVKRLTSALLYACMALFFSAALGLAQDTGNNVQTLEDIMARQAGEAPESGYVADTTSGSIGAEIGAQLGVLGGESDADVYRAFRSGAADLTVSSRTEAAEVVMQNSGMKWLAFRNGPLQTYGGWLLIGTFIALALFYLIRGRIRVEGELSGIMILRFKPLERFGHWMMASSFIILALTGLASLFGRLYLIPIMGKEAYSSYAVIGKLLHDNIGWAFIVSLVWILVFWFAKNLPSKHDIGWLLKGGGLFSKGVHPHAGKFNAGEKIVFWAVILLGVSIAVTGVSQLFPFQIPAFGWSFNILNSIGFDLPELVAHEEMQLEHIWHVAVSILLTAIIIAHIYLGTVGMQGAYGAMSKGTVDRTWAKEHHDLWVEELDAKEAPKPKEE